MAILFLRPEEVAVFIQLLQQVRMVLTVAFLEVVAVVVAPLMMALLVVLAVLVVVEW
jgi:hypothetical protein